MKRVLMQGSGIAYGISYNRKGWNTIKENIYFPGLEFLGT
jgi:hypothetical protein